MSASLRAYLDVNLELKGLEGYQEKRSGTSTYRYLHDMQIGSTSVNSAPHYVSLESWTNKLPESILVHISHYTAKEFLSEGIKRELGIYRLGEAQAEISRNEGAKYPQLLVEAPTMEALSNLYFAIMAGDLRPEISYEQPQIGPSYQELQVELGHALTEVAELQYRVAELEERETTADQLLDKAKEKLARGVDLYSELVQALHVLDRDLMNYGWPFITRASMHNELQSILEDSRQQFDKVD